MLIGHQGQGLWRVFGFGIDGFEQLLAAGFQKVGIRPAVQLKLGSALPLGFSHAAFAAQGSDVEAPDHLAVLTYQELDGIGVVLGVGKALKAVEDKGVVKSGALQGMGVEAQCLGDEFGQTASHHLVVQLHGTGGLAKPLAGGQVEDDLLVAHLELVVVGQAEGLGGEGFAAGQALKTRHGSTDLGAVEATAAEPPGTRGDLGGLVVGAVGVGAKRGSGQGAPPN